MTYVKERLRLRIQTCYDKKSLWHYEESPNLSEEFFLWEAQVGEDVLHIKSIYKLSRPVALKEDDIWKISDMIFDTMLNNGMMKTTLDIWQSSLINGWFVSILKD